MQATAEMTVVETAIATAIPQAAPEVSTAVALVMEGQEIGTHCTIRYFTFDQLFRSHLNVRTVGVDMEKPDAEMEQLVALIASQGLLQNLIGYEEILQGNIFTGKVAIVAGGRRLHAIGICIARGLLPTEFTIPVMIVSESEAVQVSLAENSARVDMHHADTVMAMYVLFNAGISKADIALAFGVDEIIVTRRMKLANVAPELMAMYRKDELNYDCMAAFALSDDHELQLSVLKQLGRFVSAYRIKELLTTKQVESDHHLVKYVTVKAYEKSGGAVVRDLFSTDDTCYLSDVVLLESLATAKLEKYAAKIGSDYAWVEVRVNFTQADKSEYAAVRQSIRYLTDDERDQLGVLEDEADEIETKLEAMDDDDAEASKLRENLSELQGKQRAIRAGVGVVTDHKGDKALSGAVVTVDRYGKPTVIGGLIRAEDKSKMEKIAKPKREGQTDTVAHSDRLTRILTSHRTIALQAEIIQRPDVALVVATHAMVCEVFGDAQGIISKITLSIPKLDEEVIESKAQTAMDAKRAELEAMLPEDWTSHDLLPWMLEQPQALIFDLLAYCTAQSCDATLIRETTKSSAFVQVAKAVDLNMTNWWGPTAKNYFAHISKPAMMEVVKTVAKIEDAVPLEKMKKDEAAQAAERVLNGKGWVPAMLQVQ
jgi:ParB family chromosome partitioning protein